MKLLLSQPLLFCIFLLYLVSLVLLSYDFPDKHDFEADQRVLQLKTQLNSIRTIRTQAEADFESELARLVELRGRLKKESTPAGRKSKEPVPVGGRLGARKEEGGGTTRKEVSPLGAVVDNLQAKEIVAELIKRKQEQDGKDIAENAHLLKALVESNGADSDSDDLEGTASDLPATKKPNVEKLPAAAESFPFTESAEYFQTHTSFPVVLLCYNRATELETTLQSLLQVRGVTQKDILAVQDGALPEVTRVLQRNGILFLQRPIELVTPPPKPLPKNKKIEPGDKIARHYGYALRRAFEHFSDAPGVVIVEDDLLFSPDFMEFFQRVAPAIEVDESLWIASAWNDNGFKDVVKDKSAVRRTDHFPGLGWLLMRSIWEEIEPSWPARHWDWFMRNPKTSRGRECVYPEVPRDFHAGAKGSYMDQKTHNRYFANIDYNQDETFRWPVDTGEQALEATYDKRLADLIDQGMHISHGSQLLETKQPEKARIIWYKADPHPKKEKQVIPLMAEFKIWHQVLRGARQAVHEFWYDDRKIVMINTFDPSRTKPPSKKQRSVWFFGYPRQTKWIEHMPKEATIFNAQNLYSQLKGGQGLPVVHTEIGYKAVGASPSDRGKSCDYVCAKKGLKCSVSQLKKVNNCEQLRSAFGCALCKTSYGVDQPSFVEKEASCLVNSDRSYFSCAGTFGQARRLCACV